MPWRPKLISPEGPKVGTFPCLIDMKARPGWFEQREQKRLTEMAEEVVFNTSRCRNSEFFYLCNCGKEFEIRLTIRQELFGIQ
jgi:hypothetical protein